uniref:Bestrophin homolog n=1 Tax=Acrobeloides nanus TaxID=290746 RepID=A0A914CCE2_9BILA
MLISLVSRQFLYHQEALNGDSIDLVIPFMTMLQVFFYLALTKVAEQMLNPLGLDDDDFEPNYIIDHNIMMAAEIADEYNKFPEQMPTSFALKKHFSKKNSYKTFSLKPTDKLVMVPHKYSVTSIMNQSKASINNSSTNSGYLKKQRSSSLPKDYVRQNSAPPVFHSQVSTESEESNPTRTIQEMYMSSPFSVSHDYHPKKHFDSTDDLVFPHKLKSIEEVSSEEEDKPEFSNVMKIK